MRLAVKCWNLFLGKWMHGRVGGCRRRVKSTRWSKPFSQQLPEHSVVLPAHSPVFVRIGGLDDELLAG
jgi:hypothetical protein